MKFPVQIYASGVVEAIYSVTDIISLVSTINELGERHVTVRAYSNEYTTVGKVTDQDMIKIYEEMKEQEINEREENGKIFERHYGKRKNEDDDDSKTKILEKLESLMKMRKEMKKDEDNVEIVTTEQDGEDVVNDDNVVDDAIQDENKIQDLSPIITNSNLESTPEIQDSVEQPNPNNTQVTPTPTKKRKSRSPQSNNDK